MQKMEAGHIQSIWRRKNKEEDKILKSETPKSLLELKEEIMPNVIKQYETRETNDSVKKITEKAESLLLKYGTSLKIPYEELDLENSGFDDARLLAFCELLEKQGLKQQSDTGQ